MPAGSVPLAAAGRAPIAEVGGKAHMLGVLSEEGLPVPDGFVIPAAVFREALWRAGLTPLAERAATDATSAAELHDAVLGLVLPPELEAAWVDAARATGERVAVRSSGAEEDGARRSFAGQHETSLGVLPSDVPVAVRSCWASLYAASARAYRAGDRGPAPGALAVLVQRQVAPQVAGVMFTVNPASGSWREMVVEAVWGLAEGLASGRVAPHSYVVRRPRDLPAPLGRAAARVRVQVVERDLPELTERAVPAATLGGVVVEPVPSALRGRPTLEPAAVRRLCRLGLAIERRLGAPQDIEWAREASGAFVVLQARPITATGDPRARTVLYTRRFLGERWPAPATPLGWSIVEPILVWLVAYPETQETLLGGGPPLKLVRGRPYVNATVFRHLAFKLPGAPPPSFMLELVPPAEERAWRRRFAVAPDLAVYGSIFRTTFRERRWERFRWNPFTNHRAWDAFEARLAAALPALRAPVGSVPEAIDRVEAHVGWVRDYASIHVCSLLFANIAWQLLDSELGTWLPDRRAELMERLAVSPPGNLTVATNAALWGLAARTTDADLAALAAGEPPAEPFASALSAFLATYGDRSEASWELMSRRWRTSPELLAPLLRSQRGAEPPAAREEAQEARYADAEAELRAALSGGRLRVAASTLWYTRRYLALRENQRFWFDHLTASLQDVLLWLGARGVERGWFAAADDVALLTWDELRDALTHDAVPEELRALVARRAAERAADLRELPPTFLVGEDAEAASSPEGIDRHRWTGLGISGGRVRGRVRVVTDLAACEGLARGEILVARSIDPAWTPLFVTAAGAVLELGSLLSHGAVVAREYRIPAVVNVEGATTRLRTGDEVTVDGTRGIVWVHPA